MEETEPNSFAGKQLGGMVSRPSFYVGLDCASVGNALACGTGHADDGDRGDRGDRGLGKDGDGGVDVDPGNC